MSVLKKIRKHINDFLWENMDSKELKECLKLHAAKHGIKSLTRLEQDYLQGRIDYTGYLNGCYEEYIHDLNVRFFPRSDIPLEEDVFPPDILSRGEDI